MPRPKQSDEKIRAGILAAWRKLDEERPGPLCSGSGSIPIVAEEQIPGVVAGGAVECPGCPACNSDLPDPANAVATHCGGRGLVVGCPVCKRRWP